MSVTTALSIPVQRSPELAYFVGTVLGDGCLTIREHKHEHVLQCVGNPYDEQEFYCSNLHSLISNLFKYDAHMREFHAGTTFGYKIYSKRLARYLIALEIPVGRKYSRLRVPSWIQDRAVFHAPFLRGLFDTDCCVCFKRRHKKQPYYPTNSLASRSSSFVEEVSVLLQKIGFSPVVAYDYRIDDSRFKQGYSLISRIELNGTDALRKWMENISFANPKHLGKIRKYAGDLGRNVSGG